MIKLRILLLRDILYYLFLFFALIYFLIINFFVTYESFYINISEIECRIENITKKDYGLKLDLKGIEKFIAYYYISESETKEFLNLYSIGDFIKIKVTKIELSNNTLDNTFNYKQYLYNKKIYNLFEITDIEKTKDNNNILYEIKNILYDRSLKLKKSYSYINTLLFGNKSDIDYDVVTSYQENGISHLFAISGTHIAILVFVFDKILKKIKIKENTRYFILILFLLYFMFLTNFSMSVFRASLFTILLFINKIYYFYIKPQNLLLITLAIILFINPLNIYDIGLQYSFSISLTLILMNKFIEKQNFYWKKLLIISFLSFIVSLPITIYNFYQVNLLSIIYNLFFVPYVSFIILPLVLISYILPFLDNLLFLFITIMEEISLCCSKINILKIILCKPNLSIFVLYWVSTIVFLLGIQKSQKNKLIPLILLIILNYLWPFNRTDYLTFIDVEQGDSTFLTVNDKVTLIDTGGVVATNDNQYTYKFAKNKIIPYLKSKGIRQIDNLILTHGDADHIRDSIYLIENYKIKTIYINSNSLNDLEKKVLKVAIKKQVKVIKLQKNDIIFLDNIKIYSLNKSYDNENDSSIVLYTTINNYSILLTGDISKKIEKIIIDEYKLLNVHILKLAHHGSNTSNDIDFLNRITPKYSIISAAKNNIYKHPSKETINNLNNLNLTYYETSKYGSITFNLKNGTFYFNTP